jgi:hypothetical protein
MTSGRQDLETIILQLDDGVVKEVVVRAHGWGDDLAHVDQVTFTCHESTCHIIAGMRLVSDLEHVMAMSAKLEEIFGFGVSHQRPKGMHFYKQSWVLGQRMFATATCTTAVSVIQSASRSLVLALWRLMRAGKRGCMISYRNKRLIRALLVLTLRSTILLVTTRLMLLTVIMKLALQLRRTSSLLRTSGRLEKT